MKISYREFVASLLQDAAKEEGLADANLYEINGLLDFLDDKKAKYNVDPNYYAWTEEELETLAKERGLIEGSIQEYGVGKVIDRLEEWDANYEWTEAEYEV